MSSSRLSLNKAALPGLFLFLGMAYPAPALAGPSARPRHESPPKVLQTLVDAVRHKDYYRVQGLLLQGANPDQSDKIKKYPLLLWASFQAGADMAKFLLDHGADPNVSGPTGMTPMMYAAWTGNGELVKLLLEKGANPNKQDQWRQTALDLAGQMGYGKIVEWIGKHGAQRTRVQVVPPYNCGHPVSPAQSWAIAAYRPLDQINGQHCFCLGGDERASPPEAKRLLRDWWDIRDRAGVFQKLDWLAREGHRGRFNALYNGFAGLSSWEMLSLAYKLRKDPETVRKIIFVRKYHDLAGEEGIVAWDYVRYLWVASRAFAAGYLTEKEAWEKIMPMACELQRRFVSWNGMADSYLLGRKFWGGGHRGDNERLEWVRKYLLDPVDVYSPWVCIDWNLDLGSH